MNTSRVIDLTMRIDASMPVYPGDPIPDRSLWCEQDSCYPEHDFVISRLQIGTHTGTHVDAPSHIVSENVSIDQVPLHRFIGQALIADFHDRASENPITQADLLPFQPMLSLCHKILFRTDWLKRCIEKPDSHRAYFQDSPKLSRDACQWLIEQKTELIGIDASSLDPSDELAIHRLLLGGQVILVENLVGLEHLNGPMVQFHAVPLLIGQGDGSPVRAYAME